MLALRAGSVDRDGGLVSVHAMIYHILPSTLMCFVPRLWSGYSDGSEM